MKLAKRVIAKSTPPVGAWNIDYVYYNPPSNLCWDGRTAALAGTQALTFSARDTFPSGLYVKSDNTKLFMVGSSTDRVEEYAMSNNFGITSAGLVKSVATEETLPTCLTFSPNGTFMYVLGSTGDDVNQYTLSTPWSVTTATFTRVSTASVTNAEATTQGVFFKPDGLAMYTVGSTLNTVREYSLSTAWNVSTLAFVRSFSVGAGTLVDISFDPTGTKMRVLSDYGTGGQFYSYTLSTAWNISTATLDFARPTTPVLGDASVQAGFFESTGRHVFVTGSTTANFYPYVLGGFDISAKETLPTGIAFSDDGTKMYVYGSISDAVHQYTLSTAWDVGTAVFLQSFAIADGAPNGLAFSSDGLKLYSISTSNVREHTLSTAWNISTATYVRTQSFAFTTGDGLFTGIYFDSTGTRAYTVGSGADNVYQYSLSTAWNISTAAYVRAKSVAAQDTAPQDVFFKPDGKTMFVLGQVGGIGVNPGLLQYTLSTAWDISTATFTRFKPTETEENTARGFTFKPDGTKMYIVGAKNKVFQYSLGVA